MATRISGAGVRPSTTVPAAAAAAPFDAASARRALPPAVRRLAPVLAAVVVALALAAGYPEQEWVSPQGLTRGVDVTTFDLGQWALGAVLVAGGLATAVLAVLVATARGGRRAALAGIAVPLATGLTAAGVPSALLGLLLTAVAVRWLGVEL
ncbi:MAG: hypothetical protein U0Q15_06815 [Kineosporiaceae bacterium]